VEHGADIRALLQTQFDQALVYSKLLAEILYRPLVEALDDQEHEEQVSAWDPVIIRDIEEFRKVGQNLEVGERVERLLEEAEQPKQQDDVLDVQDAVIELLLLLHCIPELSFESAEKVAILDVIAFRCLVFLAMLAPPLDLLHLSTAKLDFGHNPTSSIGRFWCLVGARGAFCPLFGVERPLNILAHKA